LQNLLGRSTACVAESRQVEPSAAIMATTAGIHPLTPASGGKGLPEAHHRFPARRRRESMMYSDTQTVYNCLGGKAKKAYDHFQPVGLQFPQPVGLPTLNACLNPTGLLLQKPVGSKHSLRGGVPTG